MEQIGVGRMELPKGGHAHCLQRECSPRTNYVLGLRSGQLSGAGFASK